jgi:putative zinc finger protein
MSCRRPIELASLVEYWLGELDEAAEARIDEHLLGCDPCGARLDELAALGAGIRAAFEGGSVHVFVTEDFVRGLAERGLRVREYRVARNGSVNCTVAPQDQLIVSRLEVPLEGVSRLDATAEGPQGSHVFHDVPFDPRTGAVMFTPVTETIRRMPAHRFHVRLVAVDGQAERVIGDYTFNHTPS